MIDMKKQWESKRGIFRYDSSKTMMENYLEQSRENAERLQWFNDYRNNRKKEQYIISKKSLDKTIKELADTILKNVKHKLGNR